MAVDPMFDARFAGPPGMLAANVDRERAIDVLKAGFAEGRLTKAEYDVRAARVYSARTYGELGPLIADLPAGPFSVPVQYAGPLYAPRPSVNSTAVGALTCGLAVFLTMGLTGIPAIVLGHRARREVRAAGQRGDGMALAGMILGWIGVVFTAAFIVGLLAASATSHPARPVYTNPIVVKPALPQVPVKPVPPGDNNPGGVAKGMVPNNG